MSPFPALTPESAGVTTQTQSREKEQLRPGNELVAPHRQTHTFRYLCIVGSKCSGFGVSSITRTIRTLQCASCPFLGLFCFRSARPHKLAPTRQLKLPSIPRATCSSRNDSFKTRLRLMLQTFAAALVWSALISVQHTR